jgi:hypothetical protein
MEEVAPTLSGIALLAGFAPLLLSRSGGLAAALLVQGGALAGLAAWLGMVPEAALLALQAVAVPCALHRLAPAPAESGAPWLPAAGLALAALALLAPAGPGLGLAAMMPALLAAALRPGKLPQVAGLLALANGAALALLGIPGVPMLPLLLGGLAALCMAALAGLALLRPEGG